MIELINKMPDDVEQAAGLNIDFRIPKRGIKNICISGMGGSAIGGDIISAIVYTRGKLPVSVIRDYNIPKYVSPSTLFFSISYSGNTEETISAYAKAKKLGAKIVVITSNGELLETAQKDKTPVFVVPKGYPPRAALPFLFFPILNVLRELEIIEIGDKEVKGVSRTLRKFMDENRIWAEEISKKVKEKMPFIYTEDKFSSIGRRWVTQINENSKSLAHYLPLPEMDHNEIVGWENPREMLKRSIIFFIKDRDTGKLEKRFRITEEMVKELAGEIFEIIPKGDTLLSRIFYLIQRGDYLSYYLALEYGVDPLPVRRIEELKMRLAK